MRWTASETGFIPGPQKEEQVGKEGLNIILGGVAEGRLWELGHYFMGKCPTQIVGLSWEPSWRGSSLRGLILRNCKADVCFGEANVFSLALVLKINRKDVSSCLPNLEANLLVGPRGSIPIATLSTSLMGTGVSFGTSGGMGAVSLLPL